MKILEFLQVIKIPRFISDQIKLRGFEICALYLFTRNSLDRIKEKRISIRITKDYKNKNKEKKAGVRLIFLVFFKSTFLNFAFDILDI